MPDYSKSKIYEIVCNINGWRYIGSTTQTLSQRLGKHRDINNLCKSKLIIEQGDYYINLLQSYPCNNKDELRMKEREWYDKLENINGDRPFVSIEEYKEYKHNWYINNFDKIKENNKEHYINNLEKNKEYRKNYYNNNKNNIKEKTKEYYINNKEIGIKKRQEYYYNHINEKKKYDIIYRINNANKIKEKNKEKITCVCGSIICRVGKSEHERSKKHQKFLQTNNLIETTS